MSTRRTKGGLSTRPGHPAKGKVGWGRGGGGVPLKPGRCFQPGEEERRTFLITQKAETQAAQAPESYPGHQLLHSLSPSPPPRREDFPGVAGPRGRARRVSFVRSSKGHTSGAEEKAKLWPQFPSAPSAQAARKPRPHVPSAARLPDLPPARARGARDRDGSGPRGQVGVGRVPRSPAGEGHWGGGGSRAHAASVPARAAGSYVALGVDGLQQPVPDLLRRRRSRCHCLGEAGGSGRASGRAG